MSVEALSTIHKNVGFGIGRMGAPVSRQVVRNKFKSLEEKKCIKLLERTRKGIRYRLYLPNEIEGLISEKKQIEEYIDIEEMNFYRENRRTILEREKDKCFYCNKKISPESYNIDHVVPQMLNGGDSYKNCVATCLDCNSSKSGKDVKDFLRGIYRQSFITKTEFESVNDKLEKLQEGKLKPKIKEQ